MLVLSRKTEESIMIGDNVEIKIVEVKGEYVKLGISAPRTILDHRKEIYEAIQMENIKATKTHITDLSELDNIFKRKEKENKENKENKKNEDNNKRRE